MREIIYNTVDTIFAFDNKILKTMKYLTFYPGKLTKEFFDGKVIQYVYPAKLFWFMTLLFFAALTFVTSDDIKLIGTGGDEEQIETTLDDINSAILQDTTVGKEAKAPKPNHDEKAITEKFMSYSPYGILLLVPVFAFILFVFFYKNKNYYSHHLIFSLHAHSFVFFFFTILILFEAIVPSIEVDARIYMFVPCIYFIIALYIVYRPKKRNMIWKIPIIMLLYAIIMLVALLLMVAIVVWITNPELFSEVFGEFEF